MPKPKFVALSPWPLAACLLLACWALPRVAHAQYSLGQEYSEGFSLLRFEPSAAGDRFFGVRDAFVPGNTSSRFRAVLIGNLPVAPILTRTDNATGQSVEIVSKQFISHFDVGFVPTKWLLLHADLPLVVSQTGDGQTSPSGSALGDLRLGARVAIFGGENRPFSFGPALDVWLPTGSTDKLTGDGRARVQPALAIGGRSGVFIWTGSLGYQFRRDYDSGSQEIGNSLVFGAATGVLLMRDALQLGLELYGSTLTSPARESMFSARNTAAEGLLSARVHVGALVFGAAFGPSLATAPGSAPRVLFSVAFAPQVPYQEPLEIPPLIPDDRDQDGIADAVDACPNEKGPAREDSAQSGCPDAIPLHQDKDDDGIADADDACPTQRGEPSADQTKHGCPAPADRDGDGVVDNDDACPDQPGADASDAKRRGCPAPSTDAAEQFAKGEIGPASVSFAGFRTLSDGRSVVYIELTGPVAVEVTKSQGTITYRLLDTQVPIKNNQNPLLTSDFPSSIVSAKLAFDKKTKSASLVLKLRDEFEPKLRQVKRSGGAALEIELPARAKP
ncbi:MAG TPA: transporter [Polyangiaceae bacterium]